MTNHIDQIIARVRKAIEAGETHGSLARKAGLHRNALYGFDQADWNPKADTLRKLEQILPE